MEVVHSGDEAEDEAGDSGSESTDPEGEESTGDSGSDANDDTSTGSGSDEDDSSGGGEGEDYDDDAGDGDCGQQNGVFSYDVIDGELVESEVELPIGVMPVGQGDADGDGHPDLIVTRYSDGHSIVFGPLSADSQIAALPGSDLVLHGAFPVDLDGDGSEEIVLSLMRDVDSIVQLRLVSVSSGRDYVFAAEGNHVAVYLGDGNEGDMEVVARTQGLAIERLRTD